MFDGGKAKDVASVEGHIISTGLYSTDIKGGQPKKLNQRRFQSK